MSEKVADAFPASYKPSFYVQLHPTQVQHPSCVQPPPYPGTPLPVQGPQCFDPPPPYPGQARVQTDNTPIHNSQPQQRQQHSNTVISMQPGSAPMPSPVVIPTQTNAPTYFILSLLSFILCSFIGGVFMFCIAPALACSSMAMEANLMEGNYKKARTYGRAALICNIVVYILYILTVIVVGIVLAVVRPWEQSTSSVGSDTDNVDYYYDNYYFT